MTELATPPTETILTPPGSGAPPAPGAAPADPGSTPPSDGGASWRDEWSNALKLDDGAKQRLTRFTAPHEVFNSYLNLEKKLTDSRAVRVPDANSSPEDIAAWNKARGVPDTPDGYKVDVPVPQGVELQDSDKAFLKTTTERLHKLGADPQLVAEAHRIFYEQAEQAQQTALERATAARAETETALRKEWGRDFEANVKWAEAAVQQFGVAPVLDLRLADGSLLGDHPVIVKAMAQIGRLNSEDPYMLAAAGQGTGKSPEDRKAEIMAYRYSDPKKYASQEIQTELERINTALVRRQELAASR